MFEHFLDVKLVFNRPLCHYILRIEAKNEREDVVSFKLLGEKISFGRKDFDIMARLRYRPKRAIEFKQNKSFKL